MLLCRRILRVHVPNLSSVVRLQGAQTVQHGRLSDVKPYLRHARHASNNRCDESDDAPATSPQDPVVVPANIPLPHTSNSLPNPYPELLGTVLRISRYSEPAKGVKELKTVASKTVVEESKYSPFQAYMLLRAQDSNIAASLPVDVLCCIAQGAVKHGCQDIVDSITADVLADCAHGTFRLRDRASVAAALLCVSPRHPRLLAKGTVLALLTLINSAGRIDSLPVNAACHAIRTVCDDVQPDTCIQDIIALALPRFLGWLRAWQAPTGAKAVSYRPSETILAAYGVVHRLVLLGDKEKAFDLFRVLTENHHIPPDSFRHADINVDAKSNAGSTTKYDFSMIIRDVLARACFHWGWHHLGVELMVAMTETYDEGMQTEHSKKLVSGMLDLLHTAIESCSTDQFRRCATLMCSLVRDMDIPEATVWLFYNRAWLLRDGTSAEMFYRCTQSPQMPSRVRYMSPRGRAVVWLMNYLSEERHNVHLARSLAKQLVQFSVPIPPYERAALVSMVAKNGFAESARALWERYAVGKDRELVVGNAAAMIRVVSLFANLVSRTQEKLEMLRTANDAERLQDIIVEKETRLADMSQFAQTVLLSFHKSKEPLDKAAHSDLNALARGYFLLGRMRQGLLPYRALLRRKEIPDLYDINVALSAISRHSPRMAANLVERMLATGLHPDAVTFGTVMHQALVQGDLELAGILVKRAHEYGLEALSAKTMAALILASVSDRAETTEALEANLRHVWEIVQVTPRSSVVHTPNIGECCIRASLHVGNAKMAFDFWDELVRWKAEWGDHEQIQLRRSIGRLVRRRVREGSLAAERGREMLGALGLGGRVG
ncbi:hypothetical protein M404DRAFT_163496 [Pisolithus tinctorius Marx 270]|uniref:Pentacotripeptide-repeat region of PRORP domain-containing protein n=1 Tax=Pisolithus tinctorius Marx 270 TaxID=870435 RepID=A0A0C3N5L1_PISTI|nr:hypothetical protein M404DRAFT_163496 [Pisolithus tinctorius Marx 270]